MCWLQTKKLNLHSFPSGSGRHIMGVLCSKRTQQPTANHPIVDGDWEIIPMDEELKEETLHELEEDMSWAKHLKDAGLLQEYHKRLSVGLGIRCQGKRQYTMTTFHRWVILRMKIQMLRVFRRRWAHLGHWLCQHPKGAGSTQAQCDRAVKARIWSLDSRWIMSGSFAPKEYDDRESTKKLLGRIGSRKYTLFAITGR